MPVNVFLVATILLGVSIVGFNIEARMQRIPKRQIAGMTAVLSVLFALLLILAVVVRP